MMDHDTQLTVALEAGIRTMQVIFIFLKKYLDTESLDKWSLIWNGGE